MVCSTIWPSSKTSSRRCGSTTPPSTSGGPRCAARRRGRRTSTPDDAPAELYDRYDTTVARARQHVADASAADGIEQPVTTGNDEIGWANLRRLLLDLLEEYGRHTGQADLLREAVDGRTGEDPSPDWRPAWL